MCDFWFVVDLMKTAIFISKYDFYNYMLHNNSVLKKNYYLILVSISFDQRVLLSRS